LFAPCPLQWCKKRSKLTLPRKLKVDDQCAVENITRYATNAGYAVSVDKEGTDYRLTLKK